MSQQNLPGQATGEQVSKIKQPVSNKEDVDLQWITKRQTGSGETASEEKKNKDVVLFLKNLWFFILFFGLLLLIASFGMIAES